MGGGGVSDGGRQLLLSTVDSHNQLRENRFHTEAGGKEPSPKVRRKRKGLMVHKCTGRSQVQHHTTVAPKYEPWRRFGHAGEEEQ